MNLEVPGLNGFCPGCLLKYAYFYVTAVLGRVL